MEISLPSNWESLTLDKYDGTIDLDKHIDTCNLGLLVHDRGRTPVLSLPHLP